MTQHQKDPSTLQILRGGWEVQNPKWPRIYLLKVKEWQKGANSADEGGDAMLSAGPGSLAHGMASLWLHVLHVSSKVAVSWFEGRRWQCCVKVKRYIRFQMLGIWQWLSCLKANSSKQPPSWQGCRSPLHRAAGIELKGAWKVCSGSVSGVRHAAGREGESMNTHFSSAKDLLEWASVPAV